MEFLLDNDKTIEAIFQKILTSIKAYKNGEVSDLMKEKGLAYKMNWGVSVINLRSIAQTHTQNHLLALKLWNKQWRETMILATLLDEPLKVTEQQMDFWTKSADNSEIIEQLSTHLWVKTPFAFAKALEWCRGNKHFVRYAGIHLLGRLSITDRKAINEMFEPFLEELLTLSKDKKLSAVLYRSIVAMALRSKKLYTQAIELSKLLQLSNHQQSAQLGEELYEEMSNQYFKESVKNF